MSRTVKLIPSWETAVQIYCAVLENPNASPEGRESARAEIVRLAVAFDNAMAAHRCQHCAAEPEPDPEPDPDARWRAERRYQNAAERDELDLY
jgi:hypothetical protein